MRLSVVGIRGEVKVSVASVSPLRSLLPVNPNSPDVRRRSLATNLPCVILRSRPTAATTATEAAEAPAQITSVPTTAATTATDDDMASISIDMASADKEKASTDDEVTVVEEVEHSFTR